MNVVIYARYSSHSQHETSIEGQLKVCYEYCERNNYTITGEYIDRAISGTTDNRPEFLRMIEDAQKKQFQYVIVYQLDRFSRNRYDSAVYKAKLKKHGVRVLSARENISDDASGILMESVLEGMAEYYSAELAQKVRRGMDLNAQRCLSTGGNVALGYKVDHDKKFQIDSDYSPIVKYIFESYANGDTVTEIVDHLNTQGYKTPRGGKFSKSSITLILQNKRYIGIYTYKGTETPGGIPRIISDELFQKVADRINKNKKAPAHSKAKEEYFLTTKLFCGHCKEMMVGYGGTSRNGKVYHYYACKNRIAKKRTCDKQYVSKEYIEDLVVQICRDQLTTERITDIAEKVVDATEKTADFSNLKRLEKQLKEIERKQNNLMNAIMECDIESARKALYAQIPKLEDAKKNIEDEIAIEEKSMVKITKQQVRFFLNALKNGDVDDIKYRRTLVAVLINKIYLYDDKMLVFCNIGGKPINIDVELLDAVESGNKSAECSDLERVGQPKFLVNTLFARIYFYLYV